MEKVKKTDPEYEAIHRELGCYGCKFADKKALGKGPACTHIKGPLPEQSKGVCIRKWFMNSPKF